MMHPDTQVRFINDNMGCGVFATQFIPKGTIVYIKDELELEISPEQFRQFDPVLQEKVEKYSYIDDRGLRIVSWDHAKYVNHCCNCNTMSTGYGFEIAIRDIQAGEEITDEYGMFNLEYEMNLMCAQPGCRRKIAGTDLDRYFEEWDRKVQEAMGTLQQVDQPLIPLLDEKTRQDLYHYLHTQQGYRSVKTLKAEGAPVSFFSNNGTH